MNSLAKLQAQNGLWHQLCLVAIQEAYRAKDSLRRMTEINGMSEHSVVEVYFKYHPEMRDWAIAHVQNGTCKAAIVELQNQLNATRKSRMAERERNEGESPDPDQQVSQRGRNTPVATIRKDFQEWFGQFPEDQPPSNKMADTWAAKKKYPRALVRAMLREVSPRGRGRPPKGTAKRAE